MSEPFVITDGVSFKLDNRPFFASGVNCYFLAYCNDDSRRVALATAKKFGASVIRSWAFLAVDNYTPDRVAFQSFQDGTIHPNDGPNGLERLDDLIKAAEDFNIKLILPLINYWDALGGMPTYVKWLAPGSNLVEFYRSPLLRTAYRTWVQQLLTRRNTRTGRLYTDEPAIMAWELTNEARCQTPGGHELLFDWVDEMSTHVKQLDSNHLVALGDEGFFNKKGSGDLYDGSHGVDWEANLALPNIDFGTYHFYPQDWGHAKDLDFAVRWINDHYSVAAGLNKPTVMEEFGLKFDGDTIRTPADRNQWFDRWQTSIRDTGTAGSLLWMLGLKRPDTSGYVDPYVIFDPPEIPAITTGAPTESDS